MGMIPTRFFMETIIPTKFANVDGHFCRSRHVFSFKYTLYIDIYVIFTYIYHWTNQPKSSSWFETLFIFSPYPGRWSNLTSICFKWVAKNHTTTYKHGTSDRWSPYSLFTPLWVDRGIWRMWAPTKSLTNLQYIVPGFAEQDCHGKSR